MQLKQAYDLSLRKKLKSLANNGDITWLKKKKLLFDKS